MGATPVGPSASPSPLSITHLGRWAAVARRRTEDGTEAILIVVKKHITYNLPSSVFERVVQ